MSPHRSPRILRTVEQLRLEVASLVVRLTREDDTELVLGELRRIHAGEQVISIGLGRLEAVRAEHACRLAGEAATLAVRVELRSLRRPLRRSLLAELDGTDELVVHAAARRKLVLRSKPQNAAELEATLSPTRRKMLRLTIRDGGHCVWCSTPLTHDSARATIDHVRCRSHGGADALDNLVLACAPCNNRRANRPAAVWLEACVQQGVHVDRDAVRAAIERSHRHHDGELLRAA